jgi:hypothetical protein
MPREFGRPAAPGPHERHRRSRPSSRGACGAPGISGSHDSPGSRRVVPLLCAAGSPPRRAFGAHAGPPLGRPRIGARSAGDRSVPRRDRIARPARGAVYGRTGSLRDPARKDGWKTLYPLRVQVYPIRVQESTPTGTPSSVGMDLLRQEETSRALFRLRPGQPDLSTGETKGRSVCHGRACKEAGQGPSQAPVLGAPRPR